MTFSRPSRIGRTSGPIVRTSVFGFFLGLIPGGGGLIASFKWQQRPLATVYAVIFFDCLRVKIRDEGVVRNKAVYLVLGVLPDGTRNILGIWIEQTEGAKFWLKVFNEMKNRGVDDILIAVVDGLKGFPEAIETAFPLTTVQPASSTLSATASSL